MTKVTVRNLTSKRIPILTSTLLEVGSEITFEPSASDLEALYALVKRGLVEVDGLVDVSIDDFLTVVEKTASDLPVEVEASEEHAPEDEVFRPTSTEEGGAENGEAVTREKEDEKNDCARLQEMSKSELKALADELGVDSSGGKTTVMERLRVHYGCGDG